MSPLGRKVRVLVPALGFSLTLFPAPPATADGTVQNQISVYTGDNAVGYLQPLANAFGAALNSSFGYSAYIPKARVRIALEAPVMGVMFDDEDRRFDAVTEAGFSPVTHSSAPTVVGSGDAVTVTGDGGATFSFPGGLDLNSFGLVVPQLRVGALMGTEALVRWAAYEQGDADIGKIELFGIGARHSVSQYLGAAPPLDVSLGAMWQEVKVGDNGHGGDFVTTDALSIQVQASKRAPVGFLTFEPYAGVAWESFSADLSYDDTNGDPVTVALDGDNDMRFTIGAGFNFVAGQLWADYNFSETNNFSFGLALGNVGLSE